ncbi:carboxylesterase 1 [Phoenix dactylifera]|uniref:Carboxylesterase 1 n=1 Tax=Phoenix dactylifera TaxID=42345 RepID=A0A8B7C9U3_PHODC|nr:carboxylesterase 1 [Phoenix dactylifera]
MGDVGGAAPAPAKGTSLFLQIVEHPDGTISRPTVPLAPPTVDHHPDSSSVLSKDIPLNPTHKTFIRIYRPNLPSAQKLPIVIFSHGGGFVVFSTASVFYHEFCEQMATAVPALVISLDYRLAPEHRLPAAYEDAVEAVLWVQAQAQAQKPAAGEPWLTSHGDFSRCFLMGSSSGANMAYHAGLRAVALELQPVRLVGLILNQPYFGGAERTPSESASEEDPVVPLRANDMMWRLALPKGADRDHEFCNPVAAPPPRPIGLPSCMVKGCQGDPLIDRQRAFVKMLEEEGVSVVAKLDEGGFHAIELFDPVRRQALFAEVRDFISSTAAADAAAAT